MKYKQRKPSLVEDECLACLGYFAYATGRTTRQALVKAFALCTRLDEPTKGSREGWWKFKFDNIHYAFKSLEGGVVHGRELAKTKKGGAPSSEGVQEAIRNGALRLFLRDFDKCVAYALRALDAPLSADAQLAVFGGLGEPAQDPYGTMVSQGDAESLADRKPEGAQKLRKHWYLERDSSLPKQAKAAFREKHGELFCEICGLRPEPTYGHPIVDAHHRLPLSKYAEREKTHTAPEDFAILCPSCHRAVHKQPDCDMSAVAGRLPPRGVEFRPKQR